MTSRRPIAALAFLSIGCVMEAPAEDGEHAFEAVDAAYPIVLAHGFNASPIAPDGTLVRRWVFRDDIATKLREDGHTVYVAHVRPYAGVAERAQDLLTQLDEALELAWVGDVQLAAGEEWSTRVHVPRGATKLRVSMWTGGDSNLLIERDDDPDHTTWDCAPQLEPGWQEDCVFEAPGGATYSIYVKAGADTSFGLVAQIDSKVNIIAHSMGGLDARHMISVLGAANRVASLTTISTPHGGSKVANFVLDATQNLDPDFLNKLGGMLGGNDPSLGEVDVRGALRALHLGTAAEFNTQHGEGAFRPGTPAGTVADNGVYYQSWAGVSSWGLGVALPGPHDQEACKDAQGNTVIHRTSWSADVMDALVGFAGAIVADNAFISNDGLVSVESAKWGDFRGCIPADHVDEVGGGRTAHSEFDVVRFYENVVYELAGKGY